MVPKAPVGRKRKVQQGESCVTSAQKSKTERAGLVDNNQSRKGEESNKSKSTRRQPGNAEKGKQTPALCKKCSLVIAPEKTSKHVYWHLFQEDKPRFECKFGGCASNPYIEFYTEEDIQSHIRYTHDDLFEQVAEGQRQEFLSSYIDNAEKLQSNFTKMERECYSPANKGGSETA